MSSLSPSLSPPTSRQSSPSPPPADQTLEQKQATEIATLNETISRSNRIIRHLATKHPSIYREVIRTLPPLEIYTPILHDSSVGGGGGGGEEWEEDDDKVVRVREETLSRRLTVDLDVVGRRVSTVRFRSDSKEDEHDNDDDDDDKGERKEDEPIKPTPIKPNRSPGTGAGSGAGAGTEEKINAKQLIQTAKSPIDLIKLIELHPENASIHRRCYQVLKDYSFDPSKRLDIVTLNGIDIIARSLTRFGEEDEGVTHFCIRILSNLCFGDEDNRARIGQLCVPLILNGIANPRFKDNSSLLKHACICLTNIAHESDVNKRVITNKGGMNHILNIMQSSPSNQTLQITCLMSMLTLASEYQSAVKTVDEGGVGAILAAMINFREVKEVQVYSIWGLVNIAGTLCSSSNSNSSNSIDDSGGGIRRFMKENGVLSIVKDAVDDFHGDEEVSKRGRELFELLG